jgi:hypothetical protein
MKNREKPSFGTQEQGFQQPRASPQTNKAGVFRHFHASKGRFPCYSSEQGRNSAEQGFIPPRTGGLIGITGELGYR